MSQKALDACTWPVARLLELLQGVAGRAGGDAPPPPPATEEAALDRWMANAVQTVDLEAEPVEAAGGDLERLVAKAAPAILCLGGDGGGARLLGLVGRGGSRVRVLAPDGRVRTLAVDEVVRALGTEAREPARVRAQALLDAAGGFVRGRARDRAAARLVREGLAATRIRAGWLLRAAPQEAIAPMFRSGRFLGRAVGVVAAHATQYGAWLCAWGVLGRAVFGDRADAGWLWAWLILLLSTIPLRLLVGWMFTRLALDVGATLKQRILARSLRLDPDEIRDRGIGNLLGTIFDAEALEGLAMGGGVRACVSLIELVCGVGLALTGAGGVLHALALVTFVVLALVLGRRYDRARQAWTADRVAMTGTFIEKMLGHRTRITQEPPERWHEGEDGELATYLTSSRRMDAAAAALGLLPRAWVVVALAALAPAITGGDAPEKMAVGLGVTLLGFLSLRRLSVGVASLVGAAVAWRQIAPLVDSAPDVGKDARRVPVAAWDEAGGRTEATGQPLVVAKDLTFRHRGRPAPVLRGVDLIIGHGERVLLEGSSGGGKSTLGALLAGLRAPESGLLLLRGLDRQSLGMEAWRRRVVAAPQHHENHVLGATFGFNLLMGRGWPPTEADFDEAEAVCRELGLGPLLERMPAGLQQVVGESGWQLSHGEQSRLFLARALLSRADLLVLDESLAALDPETAARVLACIERRAPAVLTIAHP